MTTFDTVPLTDANNGITSQSESPNPVPYSHQTHHQNNSFPANGTQVGVAYAAGPLADSEGLVAQVDQQPDYLTSAGQAARKYLPTRVVNAFGVGITGESEDNNNTLPSQEHHFVKPSSGGVGSLPGNASEASVAKLPDERAIEEQVGSPLGREGPTGTVADSHNVDSIPVKLDNHASTPASQGLSSAVEFSDPITEPYPPSGDGVALQHLARPDVSSTEHNRPLPTLISGNMTPEVERDFDDEHEHEHQGEGAGANDVNKDLPLPARQISRIEREGEASKFDQNGKASRLEHGGDKFSRDNAASGTAAASANNANAREDDTSGSYASDQAARRVPKTSPGKGHKESLQKNADTNGQHQPQASIDNSSNVDRASATSGEDRQSKPSVTQKIKGEVKILAGKLSNDQAKVESGQAIKKGLDTAN